MKGIKKDVLASQLNVDQSFISRIENGEVNLTVKRLQEIANAMDVSVFDLLPDQTKNEFNDCTHSGYFNCTIQNEVSEEILDLLKIIATKLNKL